MNESLCRVLVVDDDDWILSGVGVALTGAGFEVCSARDGKEGLAAAIRKRPDLIITDVAMPVMDGWTFVRNLRARPEFALVPVLFLSARAGSQDRIAGFQLGADDYLGKPVNLPELPRRVLKALAHRRQLEEDLAVTGPSAVDGKGLKGTLDQVGLATLLGVLGNGRRSGILRLSGSLLQSEMLVYLVHGRVSRVELQGRGRLTAHEAKEEVFRRLEGAFEFRPMMLRVVDEMNLSTTQLLLHGALHPASASAPF